MNSFGEAVEGDDDMETFDRLPQQFREVVRNAPYDMLSSDAEHWVKTLHRALAMDRLKRAIVREARKSTRKIWGAGHPALTA